MPLQYITCVCPGCQCEFIRTSRHPDQRFCSRPCARKWNALQIRIAAARPCEYCGSEFIPPHPGSGQRYCSRKCGAVASHPAQKHGTAMCKQCGTSFAKNFIEQIFCSRKCAALQNTHKRSFVSRDVYFSDRVQKTDYCWLWAGKKGPKGYGVAVYRGHSMLAHRLSYELHYGPLFMDGMHVLHRCDNPLCVRPDHLFLGTAQDNMDDKVAKGRQTRGETNGSTKLTADNVRDIRSSREPSSVLARQYGVGYGAIHSIRKRKTWMHIP